ncbi:MULTISPECIES: methionyl-tRNA formyltransferase [unclassified Aureimonas]|uniref:methionyl-tRNA formyltransferase n=1 Tax=unclassified Aureimonas TaxID=2615206 RepID=UPI0006F70AB8|nr:MULTISPECIES: methionyl-tRNA formyltransferase [unclassified Aureimonas]KQT53888.1 methionyl-tRNA formyltransferase [Aureimonas sp. Leaf427]KQT71670.1 methionyl-tRNA formyltransferase [Aureimonas sp. Leaf460]
MRIVFMGTPAYSVPTLKALVEAGHEIACVYAQPPRAAGRRGLKAVPSSVQAEAETLGLPVRTPLSLKGEAEIEALRDLRADVAVVVAYGLLLPQAALDAPRLGCLNGHASLLPRWRGAAPIQRAIEAGDAETGVMVMAMEAGLDTGPVALTKTVAIGGAETSGELHDRLSLLTADAMVEAVAALGAGSIAYEAQEAIAARTGRETIYARKIDKAEAGIDFSGEGASVACRINAFSPFPGAWTLIDLGQGPERVKLLRAMAEAGAGEPGTALDGRLLVACGSGAVRILELQRAGGKPMPAEALLRGAPVAAGSRLGRG